MNIPVTPEMLELYARSEEIIKSDYKDGDLEELTRLCFELASKTRAQIWNQEEKAKQINQQIEDK